MDRESSTHSERWDVMGSKLPKSEIVYFCQMIVVYVIIVRSIVNLSLQNGRNELWITRATLSIHDVLLIVFSSFLL
jgi:hypothetical protein